MDDDDFDQEDDDDMAFPSRPIRPIDLVILPACLLQLIAQAFADTLDSLVRLLCGHANHQIDQRDFAEEARAEIESIPTTEE